MISPYVTSGPVTGADFYGRQDLLGEITAGRCRATFVLGTRQIGKTSLLRQVETQVPALFLDLQWAGGRLEDLARQARREIRRKRRLHPWLPPDHRLPGDLFTFLEMDQLLSAIRRALIVWQREGVPGVERLETALQKPGTLHHKLEATLPLLPGVAYKVEWGGELRDLLDRLLDLLRRMERHGD